MIKNNRPRAILEQKSQIAGSFACISLGYAIGSLQPVVLILFVVFGVISYRLHRRSVARAPTDTSPVLTADASSANDAVVAPVAQR